MTQGISQTVKSLNPVVIGVCINGIFVVTFIMKLSV